MIVFVISLLEIHSKQHFSQKTSVYYVVYRQTVFQKFKIICNAVSKWVKEKYKKNVKNTMDRYHEVYNKGQ